jgi:hypothetical protein
LRGRSSASCETRGRSDGAPDIPHSCARRRRDDYSGFLFVPTGGDPRLFSDLNEADSTQLELLEQNWYFAARRQVETSANAR